MRLENRPSHQTTPLIYFYIVTPKCGVTEHTTFLRLDDDMD